MEATRRGEAGNATVYATLGVIGGLQIASAVAPGRIVGQPLILCDILGESGQCYVSLAAGELDLFGLSRSPGSRLELCAAARLGKLVFHVLLSKLYPSVAFDTQFLPRETRRSTLHLD